MFSMGRLSFILIFILLSHNYFSQDLNSISSNQISDFIDPPKIQWIFKTNSSFYSSPIGSNNLVYIGNLDSVLYAIDINSGKEQWKFRSGGEIRSNVCVHNDNLYLNGGDGFLYALNKMNGKLLWKFETEGERRYDFADYFHSTPIVENGIIYFGSGDGNLYAVKEDNGLLYWKFQTGEIIHTKPAFKNNKIFFGSFDGNVYALDISAGKLIWKFKTVGHRYFPLGEVQGSPTAYKNLVFIGARDYNIYALDQEKGFCHWNKAFTKGWGLNNSIHDSILYIGSADERVLIAANPETGSELWKRNMEFLVFGNNAFSKGMLYVGTTIGKLHGVNLTSGKKKWSFTTNSYLENKDKYFKSDDSYRDDIYSIINSNEQFLEVEVELGGVFSTPYISNNNIIFSSTNGTLYCLKR